MTTRLGPALLAGSLLLVAACGGGSDGDASETSTTLAAASVTTAAPATTEAPATTTTVAIVVEGATVVVANGNIVGGSAGRMTDALGLAGFTTGPPVNGTEKVEESIVYHAADPTAEAVAQSVAIALGRVAVEPLPETVPIEGEFAGEVLVLLGNLQADKPLAPLSGAAPAAVDVVTNSGSTVVVANGSGVSGSAGRMSGLLEAAGFTVGEPTNSTAKATESVVYYASEAAKADADLLAATMGGLTVLALPDDVPTDSGSLDGDILLVLGRNEADRTLADLAG